VPADRPCHRHDPRRAGQRLHAAALLCLQRRVPFLGYGLCLGADRRPARRTCPAGLRPVRRSRSQGALQMSAMTLSHHAREASFWRVLETGACYLLGFLWILPLFYAVWMAVHPPAYEVRFELLAPLTLQNFVDAWNAAPFARYFLNTFALITTILVCQFVVCTLAAYAFARYEF